MDKILYLLLFQLLMSLSTKAQIKIYTLKKQPIEFYLSKDENAIVISDSTAEQIGNETDILGMEMKFNIFKWNEKYFTDSSFNLSISSTLYDKIIAISFKSNLPLGTPLLLTINNEPYFVAFIWNPFSSFGCNCIVVFNERKNEIHLGLGLTGLKEENKLKYFNKVFRFYSQLKSLK